MLRVLNFQRKTGGKYHDKVGDNNYTVAIKLNDKWKKKHTHTRPKYYDFW